MKVAGKCPPEKDELEAVSNRGFKDTELYLEREHLDNYEESLKNCREAEVNIQSIHTPHVPPEEEEYYVKSSRLAEELDAVLVVHSKYVHHITIPELEELDISGEYGYENNPGASPEHLEAMILEKGHDLVLDTAHLYMSSSERFEENLRYLLENYGERIPLLHVCDSTMQKDGLGLGEGEIDVPEMIKIIRDNYSGKITLEVMPDHQEDTLEKWNSIF